jgi:cob(I)alamin adenosyltransferase
MKNNGLIHIYTGDGKGKTTSAVGLAVRALGHNMKVVYAHFHKNPEKYGYTEVQNLKKLGATVFGFAKEHPFCDKNVSYDSLGKEIIDGLGLLKKMINEDKIDLLVMDEIIISVRDGFLDELALIDFIKSKSDGLELVLTGRDASSNLMEHADYVSVITKRKHPYDQKILARKGIEF